ncbi:MAG: hypothetical protein IJW85_08430, partial [Clostridia bacterium]|nr:hypothetical protein [Clostridia bacterium]
SPQIGNQTTPHPPRRGASVMRRDPCKGKTHFQQLKVGFERVSDARAASGGSSELSESTETSIRAFRREGDD